MELSKEAMNLNFGKFSGKVNMVEKKKAAKKGTKKKTRKNNRESNSRQSTKPLNYLFVF